MPVWELPQRKQELPPVKIQHTSFTASDLTAMLIRVYIYLYIYTCDFSTEKCAAIIITCIITEETGVLVGSMKSGVALFFYVINFLL